MTKFLDLTVERKIFFFENFLSYLSKLCIEERGTSSHFSINWQPSKLYLVEANPLLTLHSTSSYDSTRTPDDCKTGVSPNPINI